MQISKIISPLIASQFPAFYKTQGPNFIAFIESYYQWLEEIGQVTFEARSMLEYTDIDTTLPKFIQYFKDKYIQSLPISIIADPKLLVKHIIDLYRSKGTDNSYRLLFRMLFNEDIDIYIPGNYLFKSSDAVWNIPRYIEVTNFSNLQQLVGYEIYSSSGATAVVESYFKKTVNQKTVNILFLSNLNGTFKYDDQIFSRQFPNITVSNAPIIIGSLSAIAITSGGANYKTGDLLTVQGSGTGGVAQVVATQVDNGKVSFTLVNGGYGYGTDAVVTVTGGYGSGATFKVGGITNIQIFNYNTDIINNVYNTVLDISTEGFSINTVSSTGAFTNNELVTASANVKHLDVSYISGSISNGESISNTSLGISGLTVYNSDGSMLYITGTDTNLNNANVVPGTYLISNTTGSVVKVNATFPKVTVTGNGVVNAVVSNTTLVTVFNSTNTIGYFIPGSTLTGQSSGKTAVVSAVNRLTDWNYFPANPSASNLDTKIFNALNIIAKQIGQITYINGVNPGVGYSANPTVTIVEPYVADVGIPDGFGGVWGKNATVTAVAGISSGVVSAVKIVDSGFGYNPEEYINLVSTNNVSSITGFAIVDKDGAGQGFYENNSGFTSDTIYLQDDEFYQVYSYQIIATRMIDTYEKFVRDLVHPSGVALYGKFSVVSNITNQESAPVSFSLVQTTS